MKKHVDYISSPEYIDYLLIQQANEGDMLAFHRLVDRYQHSLYRYVSTYKGIEDIDDVLQFVWLQCYRSLPRLQEKQSAEKKSLPDSLKSWLFRVAANRCIDEIRKKKRRRVYFFSDLELISDDEDISILSRLEDSALRPEEYAELRDQQHYIYRALCRLPEKYGTIIWLRYAEALSYAEIGLRLRMPTSTVKTYFYRGCTRLRSILSSASPDFGGAA
ncbi:RNA polymerase sigma factor [Tengunoibacter tsumagoiensis]|nr:sigma-70 family RNA polymerase sigma factor [Tengunoibacter tsumagoiensis]